MTTKQEVKQAQHTPTINTLRIGGGLADGYDLYELETGKKINISNYETLAQIVKRWNCHEEILEACQDARLILDYCGPSNNLPDDKKISWRETLKKIKEAIAKASEGV